MRKPLRQGWVHHNSLFQNIKPELGEQYMSELSFMVEVPPKHIEMTGQVAMLFIEDGFAIFSVSEGLSYDLQDKRVRMILWVEE